jgi:hypothetical protein
MSEKPTPRQEMEFVRADYEHVAASLRDNEELGEKRVTFFTTLVAMFFGAVGFLATDLNEAVPVSTYLALAAVSAFLVVLGVLTMMRLRRRNRVADRYKNILRTMRERLAPTWSGDYRDLFDKDAPKSAERRSIINGGLFFVSCALTAALCVILVWATLHLVTDEPVKPGAGQPACAPCCCGNER